MKRHRTKIVATIGPASQDESTLRELLQSGVDVARLNFSHGTHTEHAEVFKRLRLISQELDQPVTIMQDLQGPKIRTGELKGGSVILKAGDTFCLTMDHVLGDEHLASVDLPGLNTSVQPGSRILLDDGNLELQVTEVKGDQVITQVKLGGLLESHKGVNLPGAKIRIPGFTPKDRDDLAFGLHLGVDAVAVSFVRSAADIQSVRQAILEQAPDRIHLPIIAKLERPEALDNLEEIIHAADGVMVARGDLGVEMSPESVPIAQKRIISAANNHAKVVITATQMLDSMIRNPRPTRAEASDVANAIFDGSDAVMLSGETASGQYPVLTVDTMNAIVCQAEENVQEWGHWLGDLKPDFELDDAIYMTLASRELAHDRDVAAIAVFTNSGRTALLLSKVRPAVPILAFTPNPDTYTRINLYWGVRPYLVPKADTIEEMLRSVESAMLESGKIHPGQQVVLICGYPISEVRPTNMALIHTVGLTLKRYRS
jgi:pyruvate kinase